MVDAPAMLPLPTPILYGGSALYLTGEDGLRLIALNAHTGVTLLMRGRFLPVPTLRDPVPRVSPFEHTLTPATDRTASTISPMLGEGWLLDVSVVASAGSPNFGRTFVVVSVARGNGAAAIVTSTLAQGYVTGTQRIAWPGSPMFSAVDGGGAIRSIAGATPGAGAEISETVPTGARWELLSFLAHLLTAVAVANRDIVLTADDGATVYMRANAPVVVPASTNQDFCWGPASSLFPGAVRNVQTIGTPGGLKLLGGHRLRTATAAIQAADQWSAVQYLVREWIEGA